MTPTAIIAAFGLAVVTAATIAAIKSLYAGRSTPDLSSAIAAEPMTLICMSDSLKSWKYTFTLDPDKSIATRGEWSLEMYARANWVSQPDLFENAPVTATDTTITIKSGVTAYVINRNTLDMVWKPGDGSFYDDWHCQIRRRQL